MVRNLRVLAVLGLMVCSFQGAAMAAPQGKVAQRAPISAVTVGQWFNNFDQIMHSNIITMQEKEQCDGLLAQAIMPNFDRGSARNLLSGLSTRYMHASQLLDAMPRMAQTKQLYEGYTWYYAETAKLFQTYLKLIDNPMGLAAADESGQLLAPQLCKERAVDPSASSADCS